MIGKRARRFDEFRNFIDMSRGGKMPPMPMPLSYATDTSGHGWRRLNARRLIVKAKLWLLGMASAVLVIWGVWPAIRDRPAPPPPKIEGSIPFDRELWLKHAQPSEQHLRMNMSQDLFDRFLTVGKPYAEVVRLLGEPEDEPFSLRLPGGQTIQRISYWLDPSDVLSSEAVPKHLLHVDFDAEGKLFSIETQRLTGFAARHGFSPD